MSLKQAMEILLSTSNERILNIKKLIESIDFDFCELLIGHQISYDLSSESKSYIKQLHQNGKIKYFPLSSLGVTKNRNFLINKSTSKFIAFCDDDIQYLPGSLRNVIDIMEKESLDVVSGITLTTGNRRIKNYKAQRCVHSKFSILKVGTVEVVARREALGSSVRFPEDMGAGELYPICDEPVFLAKCIERGLKLEYIPIDICIHPPVSSGMTISDKFTEARGLCFKRVFGVKGFFLLFPFSLKMKLKNRKINLLRFITHLSKGFFHK